MSKSTLIAAALLLASTSVLLAQRVEIARTDSPEVLFRAAKLLELVDGPAAAAARYREIAAQTKPTDPRTAAQALLLAARAYEKISSPESGKVYAELLKNFPDQPEAVEVRRASLVALTGAARQMDGISPRRVAALPMATITSVTPNGILAAGSDGKNGLFIQNLQTGQTTQLGITGQSPRLSPDGSRLAFVSGTEMQVVTVTPAGSPRTLVAAGAPTPGCWTPDGGSILAILTTGGRGQGPQQRTLVSVTVADGTVTTLRTFEPRQFADAPRLSPDGRFIALVMGEAVGGPSRQVYVMDRAGQNEVQVSQVAGVNEQPAWTPDGRHLLFVNSRDTSTGELWSVAIANGRATGTPVLLQRSASGKLRRLVSVSTDGTLYEYRESGVSPHIVIADRTSQSRVVQILSGIGPSLSPDGKTLVFTRERTDVRGQYDFIVRSLESGTERLIKHEGVQPFPVRWLHDGSGFITALDWWTPSSGGTYALVDVKTGSFRTLFQRNTAQHVRSSDDGAVSLDDKTLFLLTGRSENGPWTGIVAVDIATGEDRPVTTFPRAGLFGPDPGLSLSPDGRTLAVQGRTSQERGWIVENRRIYTVGVDGTGFQEIASPFALGSWTAYLTRWTEDSRSIVFVAGKSGGGFVTMRVPATGGVPVLDGFDSTALTGSGPLPRLSMADSIDIGPDGTQLVVGAGGEWTGELWALENVVSEINRR